MKSLDQKLKTILAGKYKPRDFIIADAKDPNIAFGVAGTGPLDLAKPNGPYRTVAKFRSDMADIVRLKLADIMLGSVSNIEPMVKAKVFARWPR